MKIVVKVIRWILGMSLSIISLYWLFGGDIILGLIMLSIGLILLPPISKKLFGKKKEKELSKKLKTQDIVSSKSVGKIAIDLSQENLTKLYERYQREREQEIKNFNYQPFQIQRQGIQLLESLNILHTTKNIDTLKGRYDFIEKMYDDFIKASYNKRYVSDIQVAIDEYKTMYYDKIISDFELNLLIQPENENLKDYYSECLYNCFNLFLSEQEYQISNLKKEDAKKRRKGKIVSIANEIVAEFDKKGSDKEKYKEYIKAIQEKRDLFNQHLCRTDQKTTIGTFNIGVWSQTADRIANELHKGTLKSEDLDKELIQKTKEQVQQDNIKTKAENQNLKFTSKLSQIKYPDRINAIEFHNQKIQQGLASKNFDLTNLSYAKLIESIRQQNSNENNNYSDILKVVENEYAEFRETYDFEYPEQFLPPSKRKKKKTVNSKLTKLIKTLGGQSHPEFPLLRKEYAISSRVPATDFTWWIVDQLKEKDYDSLFAFISKFYLGNDKSREKELFKNFQKFLSKDYKSLIEIDDQAIYEIQAFFILEKGIRDFNREFWVAEDKESELLCKILSVYSFKLNVQSFQPLILKANKFLKEKRKDTDFWKDYKNYKLEDLKNEYCLKTKTNLVNQLRLIPSGKRLHFFDFTTIYTHRKYWNGDSSYKTRGYGINEMESFRTISELGIFNPVNTIDSLSEIASKSELKEKAESKNFGIKKSWTLNKIVENLLKTEQGKRFLNEYINKKNVLEFKDELKSDLQIIIKYQSEIKNVIDLIVMK